MMMRVCSGKMDDEALTGLSRCTLCLSIWA